VIVLVGLTLHGMIDRMIKECTMKRIGEESPELLGTFD